MLIYLRIYTVYLNIFFRIKNQHTYMQIRQCLCGMTLNANEKILAGIDDGDASYPDADPDAT